MERMKFQRINRERCLTEAEVDSDELIRSKVFKEFPPANPATQETGGISDALRRATQASPKSVYQICKETGISQIVVSRFLSGERDIRLATADRLAKALGIKVTN
jgi:DNA-binding phage protein